MISLSKPYYHLPTASAVGYWETKEQTGFQIPEQLMEWIVNNPQVLAWYPDIGKCSQGTAFGAPTVHVPVNELTASSVTTIQMVGAYTGSVATAPTSLAPLETSAVSSTPTSAPAAHITQSQLISATSSTAESPKTALSAHVESQIVKTTPLTVESPSAPASHSAPSASQALPLSVSVPVHPGSTAAQPTPPKGTLPAESSVASENPTRTKSADTSPSSPGASPVEHPNQGISATTVPGVSIAGAATLAPVFTVGSQEYTFDRAESSGIVLGTQTLFPGSSAIVISSRTISLAPSNSVVFVNGATATLPSVQSVSHATVSPIITLGSQSFTVLPATTSAIVIASQTLVPGGAPITVSGQTISLGSSSGEIVVNGHTSTLQSPTGVNTPAVITVGLQVLSYTPVASTGYVIGSHTVYPSGPAVTIAGQTVSIAASGSGIVVNGQTSPLVVPTPLAPIVTLGSQVFTYTPTAACQLVVDSHTLYPGGPAVTVSGETISLPASATNAIVINGHTSTLSSGSGTVTLSVGSHQLTLTPLTVPSAIVIASQTLYPGGTAITVGSETLSLPATGGGIVVASGSVTSTQGLGGYIWSGLGGSATAAGSTPAAYTGGSEALQARRVMWVVGAGLVSLAWLFMV
ncbi:hypothetical protein LTR66_006223 [Elasticomyces elasticus]|nr:hypothetical protein LTR66_006223 [Elasticomyces elasticus]